jgi:hypothetical protein
MPVQARYITTSTNRGVDFDFHPANVLSFVVGIAHWKYSYGSSDHHVETMSLSLSTSQPNTQHVSCSVNAIMKDGSGHSIDDGDSEVIVCCIAVVDSPDQNLVLANAGPIANNGASGPIQLPGSSLGFGSPFLSGFNLSFGNSDRHLQATRITAGFHSNGTSGAITANVSMSDASGHDASTAEIHGGLVAGTPNETGLEANSVGNQQTTNSQVVDFGTPLSDAVVLIQDYRAQFKSGDHHILEIGGGCSGWSVSGNTVKLNDARAYLKDGSGNNQTDASSYVSLLVAAIAKK